MAEVHVCKSCHICISGQCKRVHIHELLCMTTFINCMFVYFVVGNKFCCWKQSILVLMNTFCIPQAFVSVIVSKPRNVSSRTVFRIPMTKTIACGVYYM